VIALRVPARTRRKGRAHLGSPDRHGPRG
jgi:hypothetical protein